MSGSSGGGAVGAVNAAGNLGTAYGSVSQWLTGATAGASMLSVGTANAAGALGGDALGTLIAANGGWAGVSVGGTAAAGTAGAASGMGSALAAAGRYVAAAVAAYLIGKALFGSKGGPKQESGFDSTGTGNVGALNNDAQARTLFDSVQTSYAAFAEKLGGTAGTLTGTTFISQDPKGDALTQLVLDARLNGAEIYSRNNRTSGGNVEDVGWPCPCPT